MVALWCGSAQGGGVRVVMWVSTSWLCEGMYSGVGPVHGKGGWGVLVLEGRVTPLRWTLHFLGTLPVVVVLS